VIAEIQQLLATPEPPELGPGPRAGVTAEKALDERLKKLGASDLLRATVLLWHDHLDAAHQIAQAIETADGSYVHALIHRREPDYSNAKYWFRRVGDHPCFEELGRRVEDAELRGKLMAKGRWDPFVFVDLCEKRAPELREIQALEMKWLAEFFASRKER
jgi:hypothetical protein